MFEAWKTTITRHSDPPLTTVVISTEIDIARYAIQQAVALVNDRVSYTATLEPIQAEESTPL